jgi:hypothetical protein
MGALDPARAEGFGGFSAQQGFFLTLTLRDQMEMKIKNKVFKSCFVQPLLVEYSVCTG